jgi:hypothetical protein
MKIIRKEAGDEHTVPYEVFCEEHNTQFPFKISFFALSAAPSPRALIEEIASQVLRSCCSGCRGLDAPLPPTRWPNAGEPGGAEL